MLGVDAQTVSRRSRDGRLAAVERRAAGIFWVAAVLETLREKSLRERATSNAASAAR
jgi:hypothetical protein